MKKLILILITIISMLAIACGNEGSTGQDNQNQSPQVTVTLLEPAHGDLAAGEITIRASFDGVVDQAVLMIDGHAADSALLSNGQAEFTWDTTEAVDGNHEVVVAAGQGGGMVAESDPATVEVDNTAPGIQVFGFERPYIFTGTVDLAAQIEDLHPAGGVVLKIDGNEVDTSAEEPHALTFESTNYPDGALEVTLEATDELGNIGVANLTGVVVNEGQIVNFVDGTGEGVFRIPENYTTTMEVDKKYHWNMPDNITSMMGVVQWQESGWNFELALGTGVCPHSGQTLARVVGDSGQIVVHHQASDLSLTAYTLEQFFSHLGPAPGEDMMDFLGQSATFWMVVVLY